MNAHSNWRRITLHEVADVRSGLSKSANREGPTIKQPYLRVANVQDGFLDLSEIKEIDVPESHVNRFTLMTGDLLLIEGNGNPENLGRGCIWYGEIPGCVHQNHIFAVRIRPAANVLPEFLALQVQSQRGRNYLLSCAKSSTGLATLNSTQLREFPVAAPPLEEQRSIVNAIAAWDTAIRSIEHLIAAKERNKLAWTKWLLTGQRRHKGFSNDWRHRRLGDLFRERIEKNRPDLPLLSIGREGVVPRDTLDRRDTSSEDKTAYLRICPGDIGYNTMRMWQGVSALSRYEGIVSPAYTVCIPGAEIDGKFASYLFKLPAVVHRFLRHSQGLTSDTWNLKFHHFAKIHVRIPDVREQRAIASALSIRDQELELLISQREQLVRQKRGLMQKLLTGEWRLPLAEEDALR